MNANAESSSRFRIHKTTTGFLAATVALTVAAVMVGIADNLPGIALLYCAGFTLVLATTHRWRNPGQFGWLLLVSILGFFIMVVVHNFAEVGADRISHLPALALFLSAVSVIGFVTAVIVCPVAVLVGVLGFVATTDLKAKKEA